MTIRAGIDLSMTSPVIVTHNDINPLNFQNCQVFSFGTYSYVKQMAGQHGNVNIKKQPTWEHPIERYVNIARWVGAVMQLTGVQKVAIENYAYNATGNSYDIGEMGGIVKLELFKRQIPICPLEPTHVKKLMCGRGRPKKGEKEKQMMYNAFKETTMVDLTEVLPIRSTFTKEGDAVKIAERPWAIKPLDDICDAYAVLASHPDFEKAKI